MQLFHAIVLLFLIRKHLPLTFYIMYESPASSTHEHYRQHSNSNRINGRTDALVIADANIVFLIKQVVFRFSFNPQANRTTGLAIEIKLNIH